MRQPRCRSRLVRNQPTRVDDGLYGGIRSGTEEEDAGHHHEECEDVLPDLERAREPLALVELVPLQIGVVSVGSRKQGCEGTNGGRPEDESEPLQREKVGQNGANNSHAGRTCNRTESKSDEINERRSLKNG